MYVWFSCKAIKLSTKTKLEFFKSNSQLLLGYSPPRGVLPYENVGGACWKGTKNLFCGRGLDFITPLRDTISVSNNRIIFSGITIFK